MTVAVGRGREVGRVEGNVEALEPEVVTGAVTVGASVAVVAIVAVAVAWVSLVAATIGSGVLCRAKLTATTPTTTSESTITVVTTTVMIVFERRLPGLERVVQPGSVCGFAAARAPLLLGSELTVAALPSSGRLVIGRRGLETDAGTKNAAGAVSGAMMEPDPNGAIACARS